MYAKKTPGIVKPLFKDLLWAVPDSDKVYLTFDDGPTPGVTDKALEILDEKGVRATFFLLGSNVAQHPSIFQSIRDKGHSIGNHSWNHESGWKTSNSGYFRSVLATQKLVQSRWFRPPYGRITKSQVKTLKSKFDIVMWDIMPGDFDPKVDAKACVKHVMQHVKQGSIIVLHDNHKAAATMLEALPQIIEQVREKGLEFAPLR